MSEHDLALDPSRARLAIDTLRTLAIDAVQQADSGHPGAPMGLAPVGYLLFARHLRHDPQDPRWPDRDRFVLSNGHASMLLYGLLHLSGYDLTLDDLRAFRQWNSRTPGHPENFLTPGVETTTGPLGQGFAHAVGFAIAEAALAARFAPEVVDHRTWVIAGDGCLMEGITSEAASLAGHLRLGKLKVIYDDNSITIDGRTDITFTEDVARRFEAYGWHVPPAIEDGNDLEAIDRALAEAAAVDDRPVLLRVRTRIGYGSPRLEDTSKVHGSPLGPDEVRATKRAYGWPEDERFRVPPEVLEHMTQPLRERGRALNDAWQARLEAFRAARPDDARELERRLRGDLPEGWADDLPVFPASGKGTATRNSSGKVLRALHDKLPELIGGSADLAGSNKTYFPELGTLAPGSFAGRNIHFGVREHAMGAICNGLALHGGFIPFGATFLVFSDYMRPSVRLGALEHAHAIWVWTHDSIGLGEDGPTHQPVEHLAALRAIPGFVMLRPADANETREAWKVAIAEHRPVGLALTRQDVPTFDRTRFAPAEGLARGAYVMLDPTDGRAPEVLLMATGSEVAIAVEAAERLIERGIAVRVVSMPSWELFAEQPRDYQDAVLPPSLEARVAVEAAVSFGWARWLGPRGRFIGIDRFGASAPYEVVYEKLGVTPQHVVDAALALLGRE